ncbi:MAG: anhydro-N-acetylmuramic acid kinase [Acidobacteriaceae bacterium]|jgi:anhydro-N-acetylmuramic acid kinase
MTKSMIVAGVMSGTSADGVDVALCRIGPSAGRGDPPRVKLIGHLGAAYPKAVRAAVLRAMEGEALPAAEMSRLNWRLGGIYADCVERAAAKFGVKVGLVGCHGQTVHHEAKAVRYLGAPVRSTWQVGEAAAVAERLRCPVVSDFRPADLAAGGQGAPLVPMLDWCLFRSAKMNRVLLNLGGIANITSIPAGADLSRVTAFDTGPGNMVIDACMVRLFGKPYDKDGTIAKKGKVHEKLLSFAMRKHYFFVHPPKSCGREQFGTRYVDRLLAKATELRVTPQDVVATATRVTALSLFNAYVRYVRPRYGPRAEMFAAGGGTQNPVLMRTIRNHFTVFGVRVHLTEQLGISAQAKEGVAFALLGWLTWNGLPGNVPSATGAKRAAVLGKVSYG